MGRFVRSLSMPATLSLGLLMAGVALVFWPGLAGAHYGGVANPSFEKAPPLDTAKVADSWTIVSQPVIGNVVRLEKDDATTYPVFGLLNTDVAPRTGDWMLRFGIPKGTDAHQVKGITTAAQTFISDGTDIGLAYRFFTWEHNADDAFIIDVRRADGTSVGNLADKEIQDLTVRKVVLGTGILPYTLDLYVEPRQLKYKDTGWQDVRITGLAGTEGQELTIVFTLDTNTTAAHDSWVYVDLADIVKPAVAITSPADGSMVNTATPPLTYAAEDDEWGSRLQPGSPTVTLDGDPLTIGSGDYLPELTDGQHVVAVSAVDGAGNQDSATSTFTVQTDITPPTTTTTLSGVAGDDGWFTSDVTVALLASDGPGGSGVMSTWYTLDEGPQQIYLDTPLPVPGDGVHTIEYWSVDCAGNAEYPHGSVTIRADRFAPTVTPSAADGSTTGYNRPAFRISEDGGSELASCLTVSLDGQDVTAIPGEAFPDTPLPDGQHTLTVTARDIAGNETIETSTFTVVAPEFTVLPAAPDEGDVIGLYAPADGDTGNADGSLTGKKWEWTISADGVDSEVYEGPVGFIVPDDAVDYAIELTVTDETTGTKCTIGRPVAVGEQAPLVHALDVDVLEGQPAKLVGRFLESGWSDTHAATWNVDGATIAGSVAEDDLAAMETGYVSGSAPVLENAGTVGATLTVSDLDGGNTDAEFEINVVVANDLRDEDGDNGNDTTASPTELLGGQAHLSYIQSADDVDFFEVKTPGGTLLPYGTEVLVTLRDMPADYDVAVIQDLGADAAVEDTQDSNFESSSFASSSLVSSPFRGSPFRGSPFRGSPFRGSPFRGSPFSDVYYDHSPFRGSPLDPSPFRGSPYLDESAFLNTPDVITPFRGSPFRGSPFIDTPFRGSPFRGSPYDRSPFRGSVWVHTNSITGNSLDGVSFTDMSFAGLLSETASGGDITFEELGFENTQTAGKRIAGFSAATGITSEVVLVGTDFVAGHTYVAVKGHNGAYSAEKPYTLQVEISQPPDVLSELNEDKQPLVTEAIPQQTPVTNTGPLTLFVTQAQRIDALYHGQWEETVLPALQRACASDLVRGEVISVPSDLYNVWDVEPWKTDEANKVAESIRGIIRDYLAAPGHESIQYVVLVGSDEIVPQRRVPDQTVLGNEREYAESAFLETGSALFGSIYRSMILTDDYYVDNEPIAFNGRALYVPDMSVSRLVETPEEIAACIDAFLIESDTRPQGQLNAATAVVTGQDFMNDGVQRVQGILEGVGLAPAPGYESTLLPLDTWSADQVRDQLLAPPSDIGSLNAHFTHYGGISALGYDQIHSDEASWDQSEFLTGVDIARAPTLAGRLIFSMGCHSGLNVPDDQSLEAMTDVVPSLDIAQATARQGGVLVGSTGFGFGDTAAIAGTEALIGFFADQMTTADASADGAGQSIGLALAAAKRQYLGSVVTVTPYDEKSSIQFTMYGMPHYRLPASATHPSSDTSLQSASTSEPTIFGLTLPDGEPTTETVPIPGQCVVTILDGELEPRYVTAVLEERDTGDGSRYITARIEPDGDDDMQATADRPVQPRIVLDLGSGGDNPVKSVLLAGGTYVDVPDFDPAISRWTTEWETDPQEFQLSTDGWWPADPVTVKTIDTLDSRQQTLIVIPGQFLATSAVGDPVVGTERVWTALTVELIRGPVATESTDNMAPTVRSVSLTHDDEAWRMILDAEDVDSGIARVDVTQVGVPDASSLSFDSPTPGVGGLYALDLTPLLGAATIDEVAVELAVIDGAGNATTATAKGILITSPPDPLTEILTAIGNGDSGLCSISADARYVAFESSASNLVLGDGNGKSDVFRYDRDTGYTERVSVASDETGGNGSSSYPSISADGRFVVFASYSDNLVAGDSNGVSDVFVRDCLLGETERVSVDSDEIQASGVNGQLSDISADAHYVVFLSDATNLVSGDDNHVRDVFVRDRWAGTTQRVSVTTGGVEANGESSDVPSISDDGQHVVFASYASNLSGPPWYDNLGRDIFVRHLETGTTELVSVDSNETPASNVSDDWPAISGDGRYVAFSSLASNLTAGDTNNKYDVFVRDLQEGTTERVSLARDGTLPNDSSHYPRLSWNGRYVSFTSFATNLVLGDTNGFRDIFVHDRLTGVTERASVTTDGLQGTNLSGIASLSGDGRFVAFNSRASDLVPADSNGVMDIFVRRRW